MANQNHPDTFTHLYSLQTRAIPQWSMWDIGGPTPSRRAYQAQNLYCGGIFPLTATVHGSPFG